MQLAQCQMDPEQRINSIDRCGKNPIKSRKSIEDIRRLKEKLSAKCQVWLQILIVFRSKGGKKLSDMCLAQVDDLSIFEMVKVYGPGCTAKDTFVRDSLCFRHAIYKYIMSSYAIELEKYFWLMPPGSGMDDKSTYIHTEFICSDDI